jgi:hypothetical protein
MLIAAAVLTLVTSFARGDQVATPPTCQSTVRVDSKDENRFLARENRCEGTHLVLHSPVRATLPLVLVSFERAPPLTRWPVTKSVKVDWPAPSNGRFQIRALRRNATDVGFRMETVFTGAPGFEWPLGLARIMVPMKDLGLVVFSETAINAANVDVYYPAAISGQGSDASKSYRAVFLATENVGRPEISLMALDDSCLECAPKRLARFSFPSLNVGNELDVAIPADTFPCVGHYLLKVVGRRSGVDQVVRIGEVHFWNGR